MRILHETHDVTNQTPPFEGRNLFAGDRVLRETVSREGGEGCLPRLVAFGEIAGSAEMQEHGRLANAYPPVLRTHDRQGRRRDIVEFHPSYHALMEASCAEGLHNGVWEHLARPGQTPAAGAHVARAGAFYMAAQMEAGHCCPVTMTSAAVATLVRAPGLAAEWLPRILSRTYDPDFAPAGAKRGVTLGMGMTEKQGGTDVRANTTEARPVGGRGPGEEYVLVGHKWFMSAPMSDAFLVLAQAPGGLTCLLVPRFLPDGTVNALHLQRLKDKLGNRSNASSEVEFRGAHGWAIGEEGRGVASIIGMVTHTRLDCAVASSGLMRLALAHAIHHAEHRRVAGRRLIEEPLMRQVLADMALDVEAATALSLRLARSFDRAGDPRAAAWQRLMTPVTKYWVCKIAPGLLAEAMECLGGNGYVEELPLARLYREVPVNAIWEGSGNVMALDVLRVLQREPEVAGLVVEELQAAAAGEPELEAAVARAAAMLHEPRTLDVKSRALVEGLAVAASGCILRAHAPAAVGDAFVAARVGARSRQTYGQGLDRADVGAILSRATPNDG